MAELPKITLVTDFTGAGDFEKKHTPFMTIAPQAGGCIVHIEVGHVVPHPIGPDHYITTIELQAGGVTIVHVELAPDVAHPTISVPVFLPAGTVLRAVEHCNLHGWWAYEVTL